MQIVIEIDENLYTRLFDNGDEYVADMRRACVAIRKGAPLEKHDEEVIKETVESIWGKPPYTEMLDKIRAEIKDIAFDWQEIDGEHESFMVVDLNDALKIIDKYRAESEEV